ncbi:hypothetical protein FRX31_026573 [Thalictrum thalictroides]|uniref:Uncharacterized protein n=1 Tax=Thalictrum thalictroides TaxID=46969 RepID=A0A7J6VGE9_THATH|nr:hypothetical protein FRX31_026573 [Thalictrum thalictroides]
MSLFGIPKLHLLPLIEITCVGLRRHQNKSFRGGSHMLIGRRVAVQRFYAETKKILFWSYGTSKDIKLPMKTMVATEVEMKMGPMIETVVLHRQYSTIF